MVRDASAVQRPIPLESEWSLDLLVHVATAYIQLLVVASSCGGGSGGGSGGGFVHQLWQRRWKPMIDAQELHTGDFETVGKIRKACKPAAQSGRSKNPLATLEGSIRTNLIAKSAATGKMFLTMQDRGVRELCLGNYVEHIAAAAFGVDGGGVQTFLKFCFEGH